MAFDFRALLSKWLLIKTGCAAHFPAECSRSASSRKRCGAWTPGSHPTKSRHSSPRGTAPFRSGHLFWGYNLNNPDPSFCHVTEQGRRTLAHINRDPSNPDEYLAYLYVARDVESLAAAYVDEALGTYNATGFAQRPS